VLSQTARLLFAQLPFRHLMSDIDQLQQQYRNILFVLWSEETVFASTDNVSSEQRMTPQHFGLE